MNAITSPIWSYRPPRDVQKAVGKLLHRLPKKDRRGHRTEVLNTLIRAGIDELQRQGVL